MRFFASALAFFLLLVQPLSAKPEKLALSVNGEAAILMNADTGAILYEKNSHQLHYPASTLKIATALYALQTAADQMDEMITADQDCIGTVKEEAIRKSNYTLAPHLLIPDGSHIGIKRGEALSLRDLFYGMMVASGDDAANVIAKYVGGTIPDFMEGMNRYLKQLGCRSTTFYNPHGLHHPKQQTTAYDMAVLTREALKNPLFCEMVATVRYTRPKTNKQEPSVLVQTNRLLRSGPYFYSKAMGVKTGYYSLAGNNFVAAAKDGDRTLIAVLMKVNERKDMFHDAKKMFEAAFSQPKVQRVLLHKGAQKFDLELAGGEKPVSSYIREDMTLEYYPAEEPAIKCLLVWDKELQLPVAKDQLIGEVVVKTEDGSVLRKISLYAAEEVNGTWIHRIKNLFSSKGG
jgi:serine-type D-Ala-D-Ala carboxypeptidase (penicillin-binding protein 5/6)